MRRNPDPMTASIRFAVWEGFQSLSMSVTFACCAHRFADSKTAYLKMTSESGNINGDRVNLVSFDNGFSPPKTVEEG
jgi:hypothetical protein